MGIVIVIIIVRRVSTSFPTSWHSFPKEWYRDVLMVFGNTNWCFTRKDAELRDSGSLKTDIKCNVSVCQLTGHGPNKEVALQAHYKGIIQNMLNSEIIMFTFIDVGRHVLIRTGPFSGHGIRGCIKWMVNWVLASPLSLLPWFPQTVNQNKPFALICFFSKVVYDSYRRN